MSAKDYQHRTPCTERIPGTLDVCNVLVDVHWRGNVPSRQPHECRAKAPAQIRETLDYGTFGTAAHHADCNDCFPPPETVKRATLFDGVIDSFQTEAELNGHRATQGKLL